jgi:hypothetical protein
MGDTMQQAQALEALLALVRNMCLNDSGVTTRNLCVKADLGVHLGTLSLSRARARAQIHTHTHTHHVCVSVCLCVSLGKLLVKLIPKQLPPAAAAPSPSADSPQPPPPPAVTPASSVVLLEGLAAARNLCAGVRVCVCVCSCVCVCVRVCVCE